MERYIYDKNNGLKYELRGEYYLPCLALPEQKECEIGVWGQRHKRWLEQNHRAVYYNLLTSCKLAEHLADIENQASDMFKLLVKQFAEKENINENLKAIEPMKWIGAMNNIKQRATEIVNAEIIFCI